MSMLGMGGGGGDEFNYKPTATPLPPMLRDDNNEAWAKRFYANKSFSTFKAASRQGSAPSPVKSYTAQLFNATGSV